MAVSKRDVNFMVEGEKTLAPDFPHPTAAELIEGAKVETPKYKSTTGRVIFKLVNSKKNGRVWIDGIADVFDPATKKMRRARLLTGVNTIWQDEQTHLDKEYVNKNRRSLCFEDRNLVLQEHDEAGILFARINKNNIENPDRKTGGKQEYYEWNPAKMEAQALEREMLEQEVMEIALSQPMDKVRKHASFLGGISFVDELGEPRTDKGIRTLYVREARRNPVRFKNTLDSKEVEISYLVKRAILDSKIDLGGNTGTIKWANGGFICKLPKGYDAKDYLVELAMLPNDEGKQFLEHLQKTIG